MGGTHTLTRQGVTLFAAALLALLPAACADGDPEPSGDLADRSAARIPLPVDSPYVRGIVTAVDSAAVRVEVDPTAEAGSPKLIARIGPATAIAYRTGEPVPLGELTVGHHVSVWLTGPILESYPEQGTASAVVIEPAGMIAIPRP